MGVKSLTRCITAFAALVAAAGIVAVVSFIPASASIPRFIQPHPYATIIVTSDSTAIFAAVNTNGAGSGIIGQSGPSLFGPAAGAGVFGIFNQSSGVGEGLLGFSQNGAGVVAENFGGSQAAMYAQNFSAFAGPAVQAVSNGNSMVGTSNSTNSIVGLTNYPGSTSQAGMLGEDNSGSGNFNNGVLGTTTNGGWGIQGTSGNTALGGVEGVATTGTGVEGFSNTIGVFGISNDSTLGSGIGTHPGVDGTSTNTNGVYGFSSNRNAGAFENNNSGFYTLFVQADHAGGFPFAATNTSTGASMSLDPNGNLSITGKITTSGSCNVGCRATARVLSYAPSVSQPTMEDFGEAQLVNGQASVRLDPAFANVIDTHANYLVLITPEGDSNGVYVAQKTATGFVVRENRGGRSTLAFSYRIVAKPFASNEARLPMVDEATRIAAARQGASNARVLSAMRPSLSTVRWSAQKRAIARNPFLTRYGANRIPAGPPANVIQAASRMRILRVNP